ncbi:PREDICTED: uncharacterized protein CXorf65-like [Priapulus caudatus]|uniref:Uncharacterized protein CXorf65-like n=1 Tax=Priapulus caudatus TaxID=37621 RepID=A0ABM1F545_PRICU|nr:PREDICTED: uncharacterized protein CXorf65-like [Priapulus caudatus]
MFIFIRYGDDQQLAVNPCCAAINFLNYIKNQVGLCSADSVDLCDEAGSIAGLLEFQPLEQALTLLTPKATYIPMLITKTGSIPEYTPMLNEVETICPGLMNKLKRNQAKSADGKHMQRPLSAGKSHAQQQPTTGGRPGQRLAVAADRAADAKRSPSSLIKNMAKKSQRA